MDNNLHIITLLYRFENFDKIKNTIPKKNDITWHLVISHKRELPVFLKYNIDDFINIHIVECDDNDFVSKRNFVFDKIKNGYFFLLDDDTIFVNECYEVYRKYSGLNFKGLIIGYRKDFFSMAKPFKPYSNPKYNNLDTGNGISHHSVLRFVKWEWVEKYSRDNYFWAQCANHYGEENIITVESIICFYNYLNPKRRQILVKKSFLNFNFSFRIENRIIGKLYILLFYLKRYFAIR